MKVSMLSLVPFAALFGQVGVDGLRTKSLDALQESSAVGYNIDSVSCTYIGWGSNAPTLSIKDTSSFDGCNALCQETANCTHSTWNMSTLKCHLKKDALKLREYKGDMTKARTCQNSLMWIAGYGSTEPNTVYPTKNSVQECMNFCQSRPDCMHFTYNSKTKLCHIKSSTNVTKLRKYDGDYVGISCLWNGIESTNTNLQQLKTSNLPNCHAICQATPACNHFMYKSGTCYLKTGSPKLKTGSAGAVTGWRHCIPPVAP